MSWKPRDLGDELHWDDEQPGLTWIKLGQPEAGRTPEEIDALIFQLKHAADEATFEREGAYAPGDTIWIDDDEYLVTRRSCSRYGVIDQPPHIFYGADHVNRPPGELALPCHILHTKITRGERLTPEQRAEFLARQEEE